MLVTTKRMLQKAKKEGYAVPHFNVSNLETVKSVIEGCSKMNSPVIVATSESAIKYAGIKSLKSLVESLAYKSKIQIALHLDHSPSYELAKDCLKEGWTSIMRDASNLPFDKNVKETKRVVDLAHKKNIAVEAEIGRLSGKEGWVESQESIFTNPEDARKFTLLTKCDSLAVSIGTSPGAYKFKGNARLDFNLLEEIEHKVSLPLVLHGASSVPSFLVHKANKYGADLRGAKGVPDSQIKKAIRIGICKINTDTDLRIAFDASIREFLNKEPRDFNPRDILKATIDEMQKVVESKVKLFGSEDKSDMLRK